MTNINFYTTVIISYKLVLICEVSISEKTTQVCFYKLKKKDQNYFKIVCCLENSYT